MSSIPGPEHRHFWDNPADLLLLLLDVGKWCNDNKKIITTDHAKTVNINLLKFLLLVRRQCEE
jgi:hypothetical protein